MRDYTRGLSKEWNHNRVINSRLLTYATCIKMRMRLSLHLHDHMHPLFDGVGQKGHSFSIDEEENLSKVFADVSDVSVGRWVDRWGGLRGWMG